MLTYRAMLIATLVAIPCYQFYTFMQALGTL